VRLLGVHASGWDQGGGQLGLLDQDRHDRWTRATAAADKMRDKFGDSAVSLAASLKGQYRERTHDSPPGLPGKK
jgi:DNA polymerase-4